MRLELAHAELLDALEKAEGRRGGARAQRRVEAARSAEHALLDALGFGSYSDYMMGYSLLSVDPVKEAALDAARDELSAAEDEWRTLEAEADAELTRDRADGAAPAAARPRPDDLLGRPVAAEDAVDELRALRVPATPAPELVERLQHSLDERGDRRRRRAGHPRRAHAAGRGVARRSPRGAAHPPSVAAQGEDNPAALAEAEAGSRPRS